MAKPEQPEGVQSSSVQSAYFDNAATSYPKPPGVVAAIRDCLDQSLTVARSTHRAPFRADDVLRRCRSRLSSYFGGSAAEEIIYTFSATDSLNIAINGLVPDGSHVLVSPLEHHSVMRPLHHRRRAGRVEFDVLPADSLGYVDIDSIRSLLRPETRCIIINWVSNVSGVMQPAAEIGRIASELGIDFLLDASQAGGSHPIDVQQLACTAMTMPGHKSMMSIPGTGILYLRRDREIEPWRIGGTGHRSELLFQPEERPHRYESGTPNVAGIVGLDAAMDWFEQTGIENISTHSKAITSCLWDGLSAIDGISLIGPSPQHPRGSVISFTVDGIDPIAFSEVLSSHFGISTRPGLHCAPSAHRHYGTLDSGGTVRLSVGYFTSEAEVDYCLSSIAEALAGFAASSA
ncbi:MAG: aminotransferase class V-fold PLP-dependent enzyme [Planctomycetales bacterium]|nr:aminotransferase class V-fold PLP-dependent enzyme [bacterium]UNM07365.1 MAG: aminotransferase class V-fold PLP-dependent enzyme [Planctomycetales bacterium]